MDNANEVEWDDGSSVGLVTFADDSYYGHLSVASTTETMSGRLIILPKKSYNPWKPENVERVLRDERLERERKQRNAEYVQQRQRRNNKHRAASASFYPSGSEVRT